MKLGSTDINKIYLGDTEVKKLYLGSTTVFNNTVSLPSSTVFNLDATDTNSYNNSTDLQLWKNTVTSPADSSAQSAYNFNLGETSSASTDDPTFNGSAGATSAYWSTDGGDLFYFTGTNTTFINNLLRTDIGNTWHMAVAFRTPSSLASPFALVANSSQTTTEHGLLLYQTGGGIQLWRRNASGATNIVQLISASTLATNTEYLLLFSYNSSTFVYDVYLNSRTSSSSGTGSSYVSTSNPSDKLCIFAQPTLFNANAPSGTRIYSMMMGNAALTSGVVAQIYDYYNTKHGKTYA